MADLNAEFEAAVARAKRDAWKSLAGTSADDANKQYVTLIGSLG